MVCDSQNGEYGEREITHTEVQENTDVREDVRAVETRSHGKQEKTHEGQATGGETRRDPETPAVLPRKVILGNYTDENLRLRHNQGCLYYLGHVMHL